MRRKIVGVALALALALVGTLALVAYVNSAREEAVAGDELVEVYVLDSSLDAGATADEIRAAVRTEQVPSRLRAQDAVTDIEALDDDAVAAVDLAKGEQLLGSRLVESTSLIRTEVPAGLQEVTVALAAERAVGGVLKPGDTVGVVLSFEPFDVGKDGQTSSGDGGASPEGDQPDKTPNMTHLTFQQVPVTFVQVLDSARTVDTEDEDSTVQTAPSVDVLVTLALRSDQVEQLVFAKEFGFVWLTLQNESTDTSGTRIVTLGQAYDPLEVTP
jgi:pilus assembly protein CpaB